MLRLSKHYPASLPIDGEIVKVLVRKLTKSEDLEFMLGFEEIGREAAARQDEIDRFARQHTAALRAEGLDDVAVKRMTNVLSDVHYQGMYEATLSPAAREARRKEVREREARDGEFIVNAISSYISVEPGQVYDEDEKREILNGADLVKHFEARPDVLKSLLTLIFSENRLSAAQKKTFSSLYGSTATSSASSTAAGPTPVATVANAEPSGFASSEDAQDRHEQSPSGETTSSNA